MGWLRFMHWLSVFGWALSECGSGSKAVFESAHHATRSTSAHACIRPIIACVLHSRPPHYPSLTRLPPPPLPPTHPPAEGLALNEFQASIYDALVASDPTAEQLYYATHPGTGPADLPALCAAGELPCTRRGNVYLKQLDFTTGA
jgi:hypothetical protein